MAADDVADNEAMIFTEADVYMIAGYLANIWDVKRKAKKASKDIERAITAVLSASTR